MCCWTLHKSVSTGSRGFLAMANKTQNNHFILESRDMFKLQKFGKSSDTLFFSSMSNVSLEYFSLAWLTFNLSVSSRSFFADFCTWISKCSKIWCSHNVNIFTSKITSLAQYIFYFPSSIEIFFTLLPNISGIISRRQYPKFIKTAKENWHKLSFKSR